MRNEASAEAEGTESTLKNVILFLLAPFFGLAYITALPFVGMAVIAVLVVRAGAKYDAARAVGRVLKPVAALVGGPLLGLAYAVFFPFIGLAALVWVASKAVTAKN